MTCQDLLNIEELSELKLVAGEAGLSNAIRWLYFADATVTVKDVNTLRARTSGGELYVCTNEKVLEDKDFIIELIKNADKLDGAGIILNVGSIEQEYIDLGNKLRFPIFEIPWSLRLVDLSQIICTNLISEQNDDNSKEKVLNTILFTNFSSEEKIIIDCNTYNFDIRQPCQIAIFQLNLDTDFIENHNSQYNFLLSLFKKNVKHAFKHHQVDRIFTEVQGNSLIVLYPNEKISKDTMISMIKELKTQWDYAHSAIPFNVGIGNTYKSISSFRKSYKEADKAIKLIPIIQPDNDTNYLFFEDTGFYSLLFSIEDNHQFTKFINQQLGSLIEYDQINNSNLCNTLEVYLQNSKNIGLTSDALFIHRNTLRYRLDKISALLNEDFENLDNVMNYIIAFKIIKYQNISSKQHIVHHAQ